MKSMSIKHSETCEILYDCIVVGVGGHGSAALANLAERGLSVLGIEQFDNVHTKGSSHGRTRIYRQAYFEDPKYVPLLVRSLELWKQLDEYYVSEAKAQCKWCPDDEKPDHLIELCGSLMIGMQNSEIVSGTLRSIRTHNMPHRIYSKDELVEKHPSFNLSDGEIAVFEENAGYLFAEACWETFMCKAKKYGASIHFNERMTHWERVSQQPENSNGATDIHVYTSQGKCYRTKKLVLSVGAWAPNMYGTSLPLSLYIERRVLYWFQPKREQDRRDLADIPVYIWDIGQQGAFYGFPGVSREVAKLPPQGDGREEEGVKVAFHLTSSDSTTGVPYIASPEELQRTVSEEETAVIRRVLGRHLPSMDQDARLVRTATCMYTTTADGHFVLDFALAEHSEILAPAATSADMPPPPSAGEHTNANTETNCRPISSYSSIHDMGTQQLHQLKDVVLASPCSGHGFKMISVIGEIIADLICDGYTQHDISLFSLEEVNDFDWSPPPQSCKTPTTTANADTGIDNNEEVAAQQQQERRLSTYYSPARLLKRYMCALDTPDKVLFYWFGSMDSSVLNSVDYIQSRMGIWFAGKSATFDRVQKENEAIVLHVGGISTPESALEAEWLTPKGILARVILLDQFSRCIFRGTAKAFRFDALVASLVVQALETTSEAIMTSNKKREYADKGKKAATVMQEYAPIQRFFLGVAIQHSEQLDMQQRGVLLADQLVDDEASDGKSTGGAASTSGASSSASSPSALREFFANLKGYPHEHHDVIAQFGRFPSRNAAMGRADTPAEVQWLASPDCPAWARSQQQQQK